MKFHVKQNNNLAVGEVDVYCHPDNLEEVTNIVMGIDEPTEKISVKKDGATYLLEPKAILYFEAVESKIFVYTEKKSMKSIGNYMNWKKNSKIVLFSDVRNQ